MNTLILDLKRVIASLLDLRSLLSLGACNKSFHVLSSSLPIRRQAIFNTMPKKDLSYFVNLLLGEGKEPFLSEILEVLLSLHPEWLDKPITFSDAGVREFRYPPIVLAYNGRIFSALLRLGVGVPEDVEDWELRAEDIKTDWEEGKLEIIGSTEEDPVGGKYFEIHHLDIPYTPIPWILLKYLSDIECRLCDTYDFIVEASYYDRVDLIMESLHSPFFNDSYDNLLTEILEYAGAKPWHYFPLRNILQRGMGADEMIGWSSTAKEEPLTNVLLAFYLNQSPILEGVTPLLKEKYIETIPVLEFELCGIKYSVPLDYEEGQGFLTGLELKFQDEVRHYGLKVLGLMISSMDVINNLYGLPSNFHLSHYEEPYMVYTLTVEVRGEVRKLQFPSQEAVQGCQRALSLG